METGTPDCLSNMYTFVRNIKAPEGDGNSTAGRITAFNFVRNIKAPEGDGNFCSSDSSNSFAPRSVKNIKAPEGDGNELFKI